MCLLDVQVISKPCRGNFWRRSIKSRCCNQWSPKDQRYFFIVDRGKKSQLRDENCSNSIYHVQNDMMTFTIGSLRKVHHKRRFIEHSIPSVCDDIKDKKHILLFLSWFWGTTIMICKMQSKSDLVTSTAKPFSFLLKHFTSTNLIQQIQHSYKWDYHQWI